jgi:hypothetical protein
MLAGFANAATAGFSEWWNPATSLEVAEMYWLSGRRQMVLGVLTLFRWSINRLDYHFTTI